ncbi:MAG: N-acetyl-gamma-glutamyl-phosphate reductase [Euryarchaeota archaeon]|nr:N-acetyl-gamma-glutamyl-phosphate reductase [Euryarchaeota archaeon]
MSQVAIVGARGYLGRELVRFLLSHPKVDEVLPVSLGSPGGEFGATVPAFRHIKGLEMRSWDDEVVQNADAVLFATAGGDAKKCVADLDPDGPLVVDLSRDHRLEAIASFQKARQMVTVGGASATDATTEAARATGWTYGLVDTPFQVQKGTKRIANPGCYPTASLLATLPAVEAGLVAPGPIVVDGKSGVSGAGATPRPELHFTDTNESVHAYKVVGHDHQYEIQAAVACHDRATQGGRARPVRFTPHLVPQNRGLLATVYAPLHEHVTPDAVKEVYAKRYADAVTVRLVEEADTAHVRGSTLCDVAVDVDPEANMLVARGAIDNLVKGGSGQAVHNLNLALGYDPTLGLPMIGGHP